MKLAKEISSSEAAGNDLGLTREEKSFYDALTQPQAVHDVYTNEELVAMTKELTEILRKNRTIDWQKKESARAGMRKMIKRLLKKYHYPPEEQQMRLRPLFASVSNGQTMKCLQMSRKYITFMRVIILWLRKKVEYNKK